MTDERPGDSEEDEGAAGPHDERDTEPAEGGEGDRETAPRPSNGPDFDPDEPAADDEASAGDQDSADDDATADDDGGTAAVVDDEASDEEASSDDSTDYSIDPRSAPDRHEFADKRKTAAAPDPDERTGESEGADESDSDDPEDATADDNETEGVTADVDDPEGAAADGGSGATEFGGDIDPHGSASGGAPASPSGEGLAGAPDDQEMPLARHIEEMVRRLGVVIVIMALVSGITFPFADRLINFLWYSFLPGSPEVCPTRETSEACPYLFHPLALMFARLKVASLVGFIAALPVTVYESYLFMRPGLYPRERRYYLASVPTSLILAGVGVLFAYLLVLPTLFAYFTGYTNQAAQVTFSLTETFNLIVMMLGFFALVFQIPLLIMLAVMMGVTSRRWLAGRRIYFWGGFATVAFLFSPDPTGMAPILVAATMILLFEGTLLLLYWTGEATAVDAEDVAARRPFAWLTAAVAGYVVSTAPFPASYYDQLPAAVTDALTDLGVTRLTPLFIGLGLVAIYEGLLYAYRRTGSNPRVYASLARARVAVWPLSLFVGYLGSPDPALLTRIDAVDLAPVEAAGVAVGLIVAFELFVAALDFVQRRRANPPEE